jgi:L-histidine N-alpha-methyltransferase
MPVTRQEIAEAALNDFQLDVLHGLSQVPKTLSSRWFYDEAGSHLFSRITESEDYYPTSREIEILEQESTNIVYKAGAGPWRVVELGAGDGRKTEIFLSAFLEAHEDLEFRPIDISKSALNILCERLSSRLKGVTCKPFVGENFSGMKELSRLRNSGERLCVMYLGSSIGNCNRSEVASFLGELRAYLMPGDLALIGFDLVKDPTRLWRAYHDREGLTMQFNLNLLSRMNRELGADFDLSAFKHIATWNPHINAMESWLVSLKEQTVNISSLATSFSFGAWESVQTETSLKFDVNELSDLASAHGFAQIEIYRDKRGDFADALWMASPKSLS